MDGTASICKKKELWLELKLEKGPLASIYWGLFVRLLIEDPFKVIMSYDFE